MFIKKKSIAILGSTGSIGKTTIKIIKKYKKYFKVDLLVCNKNEKDIIKQIKFFKPSFVIITNYSTFLKIKKKINYKVFISNNIFDFKKKFKNKFDITVHGISSYEGLNFALEFLSISKKILIANKEAIVCGGKYLFKKSKKNNCEILSIDSEHYCLSKTLENLDRNEVKEIYLTASGGPFLKLPFKNFYKSSIKKTTAHPKWKMGKKISVDSATLVNKILETIEAHYLYNFSLDKIKIKIHEESKVHSCVVMRNGLCILIAHNTSMEIPIRNSLLSNKVINEKNIFFSSPKKFIFSFDEKPLKKFKILNKIYVFLNLGPRACIFFNVTNDILVSNYLNNQIFFYEISKKLINMMMNKFIQNYCRKKIKKERDIYETIEFAKKHVSKI